MLDVKLYTRKNAVFFCLLTGLSLEHWQAWALNIDRLEHWQAWALNIDRLEPWTLTGLFMHVGTDCSYMAWWTNRLEQRCWNHHDKSTDMFMHGRQDWTAMLQQPWTWLLYIKLGFASFTEHIREQLLSIRRAVYNTVILPILHSSIM